MAIERVRTPAGDEAWLVTDYDLVKTLLVDRRLGRTHPDPDNAAWMVRSAVFGGPVRGEPSEELVAHQRMRRLLTPQFNAKNMAALRPRVREIVDGLLDTLLSGAQPADFHDAVSFPLPVLVICELLGVPFEDRADFRGWSEESALINDRERSLAGLARLFEYMEGLVERKVAAPGDDVISRMLADSEDHERRMVTELAANLLVAGHETTVAAINRGVLFLAGDPDVWRSLRDDPSLVPQAVEEILRSPSPVQRDELDGRLPRYASAPIEVGGVTVAKGDLVVLGVNQANLDEARFPSPTRFSVEREPNPHLSFGFGPRFCVGAPLARIEMCELFDALVRRCEAFELAVPVEQVRQRDDMLGGTVVVPVTWR